MTYTIIDTDTGSEESVHRTRKQAEAHMREQSHVKEYRSGKTEVRYTTFGLHHRIRNDATGEWI